MYAWSSWQRTYGGLNKVGANIKASVQSYKPLCGYSCLENEKEIIIYWVPGIYQAIWYVLLFAVDLSEREREIA